MKDSGDESSQIHRVSFRVFFSLYNINSVPASFEGFNGSNLNLYMSTIICARLFTADIQACSQVLEQNRGRQPSITADIHSMLAILAQRQMILQLLQPQPHLQCREQLPVTERRETCLGLNIAIIQRTASTGWYSAANVTGESERSGTTACVVTSCYVIVRLRTQFQDTKGKKVSLKPQIIRFSDT